MREHIIVEERVQDWEPETVRVFRRMEPGDLVEVVSDGEVVFEGRVLKCLLRNQQRKGRFRWALG